MLQDPDLIQSKFNQLVAAIKQPEPRLDLAAFSIERRLMSVREALTSDSRPPALIAEELSSAVKELRLAFIDKYKIELIGASQIKIIFPAGSSIFDLLEESQRGGPVSEGHFVVWPSRLKVWAAQSAFQDKFQSEFTVGIDGNFLGAIWKTEDEQIKFLETKELRPAPKPFLAAAFAACFIATDGESIFRGMNIRTPEGTLYYGDGGLSEMDPGDKIPNCRYQDVSVGALF